MTPLPSRHSRLTSLVGMLLTGAVAACLVAFSLVAQQVAHQSPAAPVRPLKPETGHASPVEIGRFDRAEPSTAQDGQEPSNEPSMPGPPPLRELVASVEAPAPQPAPVLPRTVGSPQRTPDLPNEGPKDPEVCGRARCGHEDARPAVTSASEGCRGKGHTKETHNPRGHGKGHCEYEHGHADPGGSHPARSSSGKNGTPRDKARADRGNGRSSGGAGHPAKDKPSKAKSSKSGSSGKDPSHPAKGNSSGKASGHPGNSRSSADRSNSGSHNPSSGAPERGKAHAGKKQAPAGKAHGHSKGKSGKSK